jgi:hypothetical protein
MSGINGDHFTSFRSRQPAAISNSKMHYQVMIGRILSAHELRRNLNSLGSGLRSAHFLRDETITIGDRKVECAVVHYNETDYTRQTPD